VSTATSSRSADPDPVPEAFRALVDDAAIFPPGNAPLTEAVPAHREHRQARYAGLVGPFVIGEGRLPDLLDEVSDDVEPLPVSVVIGGGAGAIEGAVRWATRTGALELRGVEIAVREDATGEIAHNAKRIVAAVDQLVAAGELDDETPVFLEMPRLYGEAPGHGWLSALDEIAAMDHKLKFRTGGVEADAFPGAQELATCIDAALDRELAFKCTAGLHNALRHRDEETGFEHHGFLNVLLATRASLDGGSVADVAAVLEVDDRDEVLTAVREQEEMLPSTRRWFTSFGSCSVLEPVEDLTDLGLMEDRG
jgi:hypothetical protein